MNVVSPSAQLPSAPDGYHHGVRHLVPEDVSGLNGRPAGRVPT